MTYRITAATITDFKRIRSVELAPPADASVILIGGKNAQGKSSILDALTAAIGGGRALPAEPIRRGAKEAEITVEFDGGALTVHRVITAKGSHLEVRNADGVVKSPQALLDKLVAARFLDPLAFLALPAKDQRAQLMKLIPEAERIDELNGKRERAFTRRTEIGREQAKAAGELERLKSSATAVGEPIDVAKLAAEKATFAELQRAGDGLGNARELAARAVGLAEQQASAARGLVAELEQRLAAARAQLDDARLALDAAQAAEVEAKKKLEHAAAEWAATAPRRAELDEQLAKADAHNRAVFEAEAHRKRHAEAEAAAKQLDADYAVCSNAITAVDERKAAILAAAKLPVPGLTVDEGGVLLNGVPFAQASAAERLRVSLALAMAASPNLADVWVRDGALLDEDSLKAIADQATAAGKRVWIERVGTADPGVIVIADGQVAS